ncbi:ABC transporter substrate-binding protein [Clostridium tetani]|uniref:ABC transporter substrate-binding protein n=1 Tax=Clostridium tetani TaxID=1513 RepID=A0ABY0EMK9_CLOTA|nr:ABC transporter substrate-binding protein [Clostridium tetani]RXI38409.1 ABC transporter substrate-binding protein [Clostridium tetani]RXI54167.1 ABC transporter substrate-binding protein [Clostridium tetani]RXI68829.1 ABC transporter substrate-binding protein [Clostridium tetani]CDI48839.1 iron(III) dicitrate-binding periplasmic protein [Clostridium tetani 12124569]
MKIFKRLSLLLLSVFLTFSIVACSSSNNKDENKNTSNTSENTAYPLKIKDSFGREVTIEKEPSKVVSLGPNVTETIFALGKGKKVIGRTEYCDFPKEAEKINTIGTLQSPNIEKIVELKPDVVIASTHAKKENLDKLNQLGITTIALYGEEDFEGAYDVISSIGKVLNSNKEANAIVNNMKKKVNFVKEKVKEKDTPSVYYVIGFGKGGDFTPGKDTFLHKLITLAGAKNAGEDAVNWKYSLEKLIEKNPDIIICSKYFDAKKGLQGTTGYTDLKAVKNNKLFEIDNNMLDRQGPRLADGLEKLAKLIHPDAFK